MLKQEDLFNLLKSIQASFFHLGPGIRSRGIIAAWPLPAGRVLIAVMDRSRLPRHSADTPGVPYYSLHVLCQWQRTVTPVGTGSPTEYGDEPSLMAAAIEWMQGLRAEDLSEFDEDMRCWLGEMAYRMTPEQLGEFEGAFQAIPADAWGTHDNPNADPGGRLGDLLSSMGFSDDYLLMHL